MTIHLNAVNLGAMKMVLTQFDSESEDAMALRFGKPSKKRNEWVFEFTRDPGLLHQYHLICQREAEKAFDDVSYLADKKADDRRDSILIVRRGNFCVGGARISTKSPRQPYPLPLEIDGFAIAEHFPVWEQQQKRYGQISGFCLLEEFRSVDIEHRMLQQLYRKMVALNLNVIFTLSEATDTQTNSWNYTAMGLNDVKIHQDINLSVYPPYAGRSLCLMSGEIDAALVDSTADIVIKKADFALERL